MHIDQLTLKNFRNFESVDIPLNSKMNIVIGNNGSGKSSLLMGALTAASAFFLGIDYASPRSIKTDVLCSNYYYRGDNCIVEICGGYIIWQRDKSFLVFIMLTQHCLPSGNTTALAK